MFFLLTSLFLSIYELVLFPYVQLWFFFCYCFFFPDFIAGFNWIFCFFVLF